MAQTVRVRVTTNVRRVSNGTYRVKTTTRSGGMTKTNCRTLRVR